MKGISPFIAYSLVIMLSVSAIGVVLLVAVPTFNRAQDTLIINAALNNMQQLDSLVREVASEGTGSLRTTLLTVTGGKYFVTNIGTLIFSYDTHDVFIPNGTNITQGNVRVQGGQTGASGSLVGSLKNLNITLQYGLINITGTLSVQSGNYKLCVQKTGVSAGQATVSMTVC